MIKVEIKEVSKNYTPGKPVLQKLDLDIEPGELFFLLGPSGCGKTTLLRLIAGFLQADTGTILFDRQDVTALPAEKRNTGLVFQNYALWPHMSVFDNVAFGLDTRKIRGEERRKQVMEALSLVRMADFADRKPTSLSGGQQQRVALARALAFRPRLRLLAEPLTNLHAKLRDSMRLEIRRICKTAGLTAIYVTHDRKEALSMADRIAIMNRGKLEQIGTPQELYGRPLTRFTAEFMGQSNFFPATVAEIADGYCHVDTPLGRLQASLPPFPIASGNCLTAMVRTECIRPDADEGMTNTFSARLLDGSYQGENTVWELAAGELRLSVLEACPPPRRPGDIRCGIAPENLVLLEDN